MRKLCLLFAGGALIALFAASTAWGYEPQSRCPSGNSGYHIYPDQNPGPGNVDTFRLSFDPSIHGDLTQTDPNKKGVSTVLAGGIACGTDTETWDYPNLIQIFEPNGGQQDRCTVPSNTSTYCKNQEDPTKAPGGPYYDLPDGAYMGKATIDTVCHKGSFLGCPKGRTTTDTAYIFVRYNTKRGSYDDGPNRCPETNGVPNNDIYACMQGESQIFLGFIDCNSDILIRKGTDLGAPVEMDMYEIYCDDGSDDEYLVGIRDLQLCAWANTTNPGSKTCGKPGNETGTRLNGKVGTWTYTLRATTNQGNKFPDAKAQVTWT